MTRIVPLGAAGDLDLSTLLRSGGVIGLPTDTLYGLAADPFSTAGVERIFEMKGRPATKAMPILVADLDQLEGLGVVGGSLLDTLARVWPAPLTVVLPVAAPFAATAGLPSAAIRIPDHDELRALLRRVGPLTATSANRSGEPTATSAAEVATVFGDELDLVLDDGPSRSSVPSTLVDGTVTPPAILRKGPFSWPPSYF